MVTDFKIFFYYLDDQRKHCGVFCGRTISEFNNSLNLGQRDFV